MTTKTLPEVPAGMQRIYRRFERWRSSHPRALADSQGLVGIRREGGSGTWGLPHRQDPAPGVWQAEAHGGIGHIRCEALANVGGVSGVGGVAGAFRAGLSECLIELEGPRGKMRIQWKGATAPDLAGLSRALWASACSRSRRTCPSWWRSRLGRAERASARWLDCARTSSKPIP